MSEGNKTHTHKHTALVFISLFCLPKYFLPWLEKEAVLYSIKVLQLCYIQHNTSHFTLSKNNLSDPIKAEHIINRSAPILISVDCEYCVFVNTESSHWICDAECGFSFLTVSLFISACLPFSLHLLEGRMREKSNVKK